MRSFNRRVLVTCAAAAAVSLSLAACGVGGSAAEQPQDSGAADGEITGEISFQTWNLKASFEDYFNGVIDDFEAEHPGTTVKWIDQPAEGYADKLSADAAGGTLPDVINIDRGTGSPLAEAGMLVNLDEADASAGADFLDSAWDGNDWTDVGGHYAYPWYLNTGPSLFNTALFEKAGLDPESVPTDYDELFEKALQMAEKSNGKFAMLGVLPGTEMLEKYGIEVMNADQTEYTFNSPEAVALIEKYKEMYEAGAVLPEALTDDYVGEGQNFSSGRLAFMDGSAYAIQDLKDNAPSVYEHLVYTKQITNTGPVGYSQSVAVSADSANKATAIAFAKFVTNAENQVAFAKQVNIFPSTVGSLDDEYFHTSDGSDDAEVRVMSAEQLPDALISRTPGNEALKTEVRDAIAQAVLGKKPVQDALDDAVAFGNEQLQD